MIIIGPTLVALGGLWRRDWKRILIVGVTGSLALGLIISPWIVRNYATFGRVIPVAKVRVITCGKATTRILMGPEITETNNRSAAAASSGIRKSIPYGPGYETRLQDAYLRAFHKDIRDSSNGRIAKLVLNKIALLWTFDWTDRGVVVRPDYLIPWLVTNLLCFDRTCCNLALA